MLNEIWNIATIVANNPYLSTIVALVTYGAFLSFGKMILGNIMIGSVFALSIPALNLTAYLMGWLTPELKPFMPLWITAILIVIPFIYQFFRIFTTQKEGVK